MPDLEIEVTQEDIEKAGAGDGPRHCPIERALLRMFPGAMGAFVGHETAKVTTRDGILRWYLDETLVEFVYDYDEGPPCPLPTKGRLLVYPRPLDYGGSDVGPDIPGGGAP
jgi:hypothetical protein